MEQELIEFIKTVSSLPNTVIIGMGLFLIYKAILYLSTTGAIMYLGREILKKFPLIIVKEKDYLKKQDSFLFHGLVVKGSNKQWFYNRESLGELGKEGEVTKYYTTTERVDGLF